MHDMDCVDYNMLNVTYTHPININIEVTNDIISMRLDIANKAPSEDVSLYLYDAISGMPESDTQDLNTLNIDASYLVSEYDNYMNTVDIYADVEDFMFNGTNAINFTVNLSCEMVEVTQSTNPDEQHNLSYLFIILGLVIIVPVLIFVFYKWRKKWKKTTNQVSKMNDAIAMTMVSESKNNDPGAVGAQNSILQAAADDDSKQTPKDENTVNEGKGENDNANHLVSGMMDAADVAAKTVQHDVDDNWVIDTMNKKNEGETMEKYEEQNTFIKITKILQQCDEKEWAIYLNNFKREKMTDDRMQYLQNESVLWDKLIPETGVRLQFQHLWNDVECQF